MKKYLLPSIIADLFTSAKGYATPATQIAPAGNRFRTFSLKPILVKTALVVFSLFFVNAAFAARRITSITVSGQSKTVNVGTATTNIQYTITVNEAGTNGGTLSETITIGALPAGVTVTNPASGVIGFTPAGNGETLTFTLSTSAATPAGAFTITLTPSNRNGNNPAPPAINATLNVTKRALVVTASASSPTITYGQALPALTLAYATFAPGDSPATVFSTLPTATTTATATPDAGSYTVTANAGVLTAAGAANYNVTYANSTLTVNKLTLTITGLSTSKTYDGTRTAIITGTATPGNAIAGDVVNISGTPVGQYNANPANVGTQTVTITGGLTLTGADAGNYALPAPITINGTISPLAITISGSATRVYGSPVLTSGTGKTTGFTVSPALPAGQTPSVRLTYGAGNTIASRVTTYPGGVVASQAVNNGAFLIANYTISYAAGDYVVTPATLTIKAAASNKNYGTANPPFTVTYTGFITTNGDNVGNSVITLPTTTSGATTTTPAGTYTTAPNYIIPSAAVADSNYTVAYASNTFTINKAPLTAVADNLTKVQGQVNPTFTVSYTGFVNGDLATTPGVITTTPILGSLAGTGSPAGNYDITFSRAPVAPNYTVTTVKGTLTILSPTFDWTGATGTNVWTTPQNWSIGGTQQTTLYPGTGGADVAHIGVNTAIASITIFPVLAASKTIATLEFGSHNGAMTLTVNTGVTLNMSNFIVDAGATANIINNGPINVGQGYTTSASSAINLSGSNAFSVNLNNLTNSATITQTNGASLTLNGTVVFTNNGPVNQNGTGATTLSGGIWNNNSAINQGGTGTLVINNCPFFTNSGSISQSGGGTINISAISGIGIIDIFAQLSNTGTITQSGTGGTMNFTIPNGAFNPIANSKNIFQTGTGGTISFNGDFNNSAAGAVISQTGGGSINFNNVFTNHGTATFGPAPSSVFFSDDFTNTSGTTTFGTGLATFNSGSSAANPTSITQTPNASLTFINVAFNTGNYQLRTGNGSTSPYILASNGVMTLSNAAAIDFSPAVGLRLKSDATGSATIATIPANCTITANNKVTVERFIKGSADLATPDLSKRGYRLITSTVYTGSAATGGDANAGNSFDLQYLVNSGAANSVFVSGTDGAANGFNVPSTNNPTVYLFREDETPPPTITTIFTTGYNWKGVTKLTGLTPSFATGTTSFGTTTNVFNQTVQLPVGNGVLFYFRGAGIGLANAANYTAPFTPPVDVTLTEKGTLNTGPIPVKLWYNYANGTAFPYTAGNEALDAPRPAAGFALVGNPYPSTINWEKFNNASLGGGISGTTTSTIYEFNELNREYEVYQAGFADDPTDPSERPDGSSYTGSASNYIASGQGFFVLSGPGGGSLTFTEAAKINAQPAPATFLKFMGKPKATVKAPTPFIRLKMITDSVNYDDIIIRLKDNANSKFDVHEDAVDLGGNGNLQNISSFSTDSVQLAINTLPLPGLKPFAIRLFTGSPNSGTVTLNVAALKNMPSLYRIWLKDGFTGDSVDLRKTANYSFTIDKANAATFGAGRFTVTFSQDTANAYHLINFDAQKVANEQKVQATWTTKNEENYTNFTVERSTDDGNTFNVVGGLQGSGAGLYSLVDKNPSKGSNVYRLKQEDINNVITYSKLVEVFFGKDNKIHLYPNPAVNVINVDVRERWHDKDKYEIIVTNSSGTVVKHGTSGDSQWQAGISNLRPGTYLVSVLSKDDKNLVGQAKFVKL